MSNVIAPKEGHVFVATYGSLRRGQSNFRVNEAGGGEFFCIGKTAEDYNLYQYGGAYFPSVSLAHNSHGTQVVVDVFEVPEAGLTGAYDRLEGYYGADQDNFYNRSLIDVLDIAGNTIKAYIYHIDEEQRNPVPHGDWCVHLDPDYYETLEA